MAVALLLVHTACFSYKSLEPQPSGTASASTTASAPESSNRAAELGLSGVKQGTRLRLHLNEPGSYPLTDVTPNTVTVIDGDLIRVDETDVRVSVYWLKTSGVQEYKGHGETVTVPLAKIDMVEERKLSVGKTAALSAAILGAVVALGVTLGTGSGEGQNGGPPPTPD